MKPTVKNARTKAIGMETGVPQSEEKKMPKVVPMRNDKQATDSYPNPMGNSLRISPGNSVDKLLKSAPMTEEQRLKLMDTSKTKAIEKAKK